jgi:hypothetical protein
MRPQPHPVQPLLTPSPLPLLVPVRCRTCSSRKRSRMTRSGTTPTVSAPEGALQLTRANFTPARPQPIETVVSSPSSPGTGINLSGLNELIQSACDQSRQSTVRITSATPDPTSHPCRCRIVPITPPTYTVLSTTCGHNMSRRRSPRTSRASIAPSCAPTVSFRT